MGRTPDRFAGPRQDEEVQFEEQATDPTVEGAIRNVLGDLKAKDQIGVFNLRQPGLDFDNYIFDVAGAFVYTGDMDPLTRS